MRGAVSSVLSMASSLAEFINFLVRYFAGVYIFLGSALRHDQRSQAAAGRQPK
jgi:hypothetical protein